MALTTVQSGMMDSIAQYNSFKNRIINGDMRIDQRNAGASVTLTSGGAVAYAVDRFYGYYDTSATSVTNQQVTDVPTGSGFVNSYKWTTGTGGSATAGQQARIIHRIEGLNIADLMWGTVNAKTITISFWVKSSLTGTFSCAVQNSAADRSYVGTYSILSANTWEQKSITIAGDTTGTWLTTNGIGIGITFDLGSGSNRQTTANTWTAGNYHSQSSQPTVVGTSGATFYVTGVQLEKGSTATAFDYRPYGTELQLCQRYYEKSFPQATAPASSLSGTGANHSSATKATTGANQLIPSINFKVTKRATPSTITTYSPTVAGAQAYNVAAGACSSTALYLASDTNISFTFTGNAGGVVADIIQLQWTAEAEL